MMMPSAISSLLPRRPVADLAAALLLTILTCPPAAAHPVPDSAAGVPRTAVISAFAPELAILKQELSGAEEHRINGVSFTVGNLEGKEVVLFLSGISVVNATMTLQLALDHFTIDRVLFSGIAGGVDPSLNIGDVVIADRWGQYLESVFAREVGEGWDKPPFFEYPYPNFGMMFPRSVDVVRAGNDGPETRFWFPVDDGLLATASRAREGLTLTRCTANGVCLDAAPRIIVGGAGVSGGAFIDNAEFREYAFRTFEARVLDMESSAIGHVAYANDVPYIAVRSLSDLAGGGEGQNQMATFLELAAANAAQVLKAMLRALP